MRRSIWGAACALFLMVTAQPAKADWIRAETDHFIVYGEVADFIVRDYAVRLSNFDALLRLYNPPPPKAAPQKLQVYVVRQRKDLQRVKPDIDPDIAGFYSASANGVFAIASADGGHTDDDVLFHEYAHHYMLDHFPAAYPAWFVEGWAEYFMTTEFSPKGAKVGNFNQGRVDWLQNARWLPMGDVLAKSPTEIAPDNRSLYYAQAWLLTHYMRSNPARSAQMNQITAAAAEGADSVKTFQSVTGMDMDKLGAALRGYRSLPMQMINGFGKTPPAVTVTRLPASADDLLLARLRLISEEFRKPDPAFLADVRRLAAKYPGDRLAELTLADAEFTMGDVAAGEAIVKRRLAADPNDVETLTEAGYGELSAGRREPAHRADRYRAARPYLSKAYELDKGDYRILYGYALTRTIEPGFPTNEDVKALLQARLLAPAVADTSMLAGEALLMRNDPDDARKVLGPVANNPHGGGAAARARALMKARTGAEAAAVTDGDEEDGG